MNVYWMCWERCHGGFLSAIVDTLVQSMDWLVIDTYVLSALDFPLPFICIYLYQWLHA